MQLIHCPKCQVQLLASAERAPKCGKCGHPLSIEFARRQTFVSRFWDWVFKKPANKIKPTVKSPLHMALQTKVEFIAKKSWGARGDILAVGDKFLLKKTAQKLNHIELIENLLNHVRRTAPNLSVPMMIPRVIKKSMIGAGGEFIEEDGFVTITVNSNFFDDLPAARAILCHEICHYILLANGIRQSPIIENEKLTDVAIFVFGLGKLYLSGYKRVATENRNGHKFGYLKDSEYSFVEQYVDQLRCSEEFLLTAKKQNDWKWDRSLR